MQKKFLLANLILLCFSTAIPCLAEQAIASEVTTNTATSVEGSETLITLATRLVIKLKERRVYVYQDAKVLTSYPIAIGRKGWETPKGNFQVLQMLRNPQWEHPWTGEIVPTGPDNPLGKRWIGFWTDGKNTIGFHGTPAEQLVGQAVSHGCIRMRNKDVETLFEMVKVGTPVIVQP